jgi:hypothetical protein
MDEVINLHQVHHHSGWTYMAHYAQHLFQLQHDTQCIIVEQQCHLVGYAKEVENLTHKISHMAQENGVVHQQFWDLESRLRNKEQELSKCYRR